MSTFDGLVAYYVDDVMSLYDDEDSRANIVATYKGVYSGRPTDAAFERGEITEREWVETTTEQDILDGEDEAVFAHIVDHYRSEMSDD